MDTIRAIIVDDEESARNVLSNLLQHFCESVSVLAQCSNLLEGVNAIQKYQPDVVFLDVKMPNYAGYEIVNFIEDIDFEIIFVTAYDQYAIKAFELSALDYLLKPINRVRLADAVEKVRSKVDNTRKIEQLKVLISSMNEEVLEKIIISELGNKRVIEVNDIIAVQAQGSYCTIFTKGETQITVSKNLKYFENLFVEVSHFFRTHKSWIINLKSLKSVQLTKGSIVLEEGVNAKLSKYRIEDFKKGINDLVV